MASSACGLGLSIFYVDGQSSHADGLHRLYTQVCKEVASVTRTAEGGLETKHLDPNAVICEEEVKISPTVSLSCM